jgi:DNA ligase-1
MNQTLYKSTKSEALQQWSISTEGATFTCVFGRVDGKLQSQTTTCEGKNIGRANETTPEQQAILEAEALVTKKLKSGYSTSITCDSEVQLPMKVKSYQDQISNVKFPCISTPKLDGVNAIVRRANGALTWYSRGGEIYPDIPHLTQSVHKAMDVLYSNELNGELYIHGEYLQDIQSAVKKPKDLSQQLTFAIFDIADSTEPYSERRNLLRSAKANHVGLIGVSFIVGVVCLDHTNIENHYKESIRGGYEGTVIKNLDGLYQHNVRSSEQFKYKKAQSAEFLIAGFELDKRSHPVFHLFADSTQSKVFKAKPKGTHEFLSSIDPQTYIGQWATLEYETLSKDSIPLKPIFIGLRKCDSNGTPLE